jgi:hypothetical protein
MHNFIFLIAAQLYELINPFLQGTAESDLKLNYFWCIHIVLSHTDSTAKFVCASQLAMHQLL